MKFKVIADIQGNFLLEEREEDFEIACPFCENIDIYHVEEDTDLYCSKCGKLLVIKGKGRTCFDFEDVTKLKNIIKRGTAREDRRNALILLGRVLEWCEDLTLAEFLLHLSLMDPDKWIRERAEQILNQQREAGTAKVKSEIKKLKTSQNPPSLVKPLSEDKKNIIHEEIPVKDLSDTEEISEQKEDLKKAKLVDILLEVIDDDTREIPSSPTDFEHIDNIDELLEVAMGSIESTKEVLEHTCEAPEKAEIEIEYEGEEERDEEIQDKIERDDKIEREDEMEDEIVKNVLPGNESLTEDVDDITAQELLDKPIEDLLDGITIESLLEEFALTEDFNEKADILFIMGEMKFVESTEFLLDLMQNDPDYELRLISLQALEKIGDKSIAPAILDSMKKEQDTDFRKKIAGFYSQLRYKSE